MGSWEEGWREGAAGGLKPGPASPFLGLPGSYHIPPWGLGLEGKGRCSAFPVIPTPSADLPAQMYLCTLFTTQLPWEAFLGHRGPRVPLLLPAPGGAVQTPSHNKLRHVLTHGRGGTTSSTPVPRVSLLAFLNTPTQSALPQ